jgi:lipopolysaccharide export system permease protein
MWALHLVVIGIAGWLLWKQYAPRKLRLSQRA